MHHGTDANAQSIQIIYQLQCTAFIAILYINMSLCRLYLVFDMTKLLCKGKRLGKNMS